MRGRLGGGRWSKRLLRYIGEWREVGKNCLERRSRIHAGIGYVLVSHTRKRGSGDTAIVELCQFWVDIEVAANCHNTRKYYATLRNATYRSAQAHYARLHNISVCYDN